MPAHPDVVTLWQAAIGSHQAGRLAEAESHYRLLLERQPDHADALHLLGVLVGQTGRRAEALPLLRRAVSLRADQPPFWNNLGEMCRLENLLPEALGALDRAVQLAPGFPEAHLNRGNVLKDQGRLDEAIAAFRQAAELQPRYAKAHFNLANTLRATGRVPWAVDAYQRALALRPDWTEAHLNLGVAQLELGDTAAAIASFQHARQLAPTLDEIDENLASAFHKQGKLAEARTHYQRTLDRHPERWLHRLRLDTLAEVIPASNAAIDDYRAELARTLERCRQEPPALDLSQLAGSGAEPPMALAYQGRDDRPLKTAYATFFANLIPAPDPRPGAGKPHVGIVVTHGHEGVFARCLGGLVERLSAARLRVSLASSLRGVNVLRHLLPRFPHEFLTLPDELPEAAACIRQAGVDLLHYWEVGTDSVNYFLPFLRPARRQSTCWGWPVTTGNPRIDYFVSSKWLEPADGAAHYSEKLVLLPSLPTYYERPPAPTAPPDRGRWGVSAKQRLYLCVQNLRKVHPDFDGMLADILRADADGLVLLIGDEQASITERLMARLRQALPDVAGRLRVLPRLERADYLGLVAAADVILDTPHYGGGANSIYDAVAAGTPTVTLPGAYHRGRYAAGVWSLLEVPDLVAGGPADYAARAVAIAGDPGRRRMLHEKILAGAERVFADRCAVSELEEFFLKAIEESRQV